jgi:hypothetical protein
MMAFDAMEPEHLAFLYELYTRSAGDARQGVPYEALIDALGFDERVTKRIQHELQREGPVDQPWGACAGAPRHVCSRLSADPPHGAPPSGRTRAM